MDNDRSRERLMTRRYLNCSIFVCAALLLASASAQPAAAEGRARVPSLWAGAFTYAGDGQEREALERAIDRATAEMGPLARRIARSRLERELRPDPRLVVRIDGRVIGIGEQGNWRTVLDGPARIFDADGDHYRVQYRSAGQGIIQVIEGDSVRILKAYALSADGAWMHVSVTFFHDRLPAPLRFDLSYRRSR
jgi:hypothetical protein